MKWKVRNMNNSVPYRRINDSIRNVIEQIALQSAKKSLIKGENLHTLYAIKPNTT